MAYLEFKTEYELEKSNIGVPSKSSFRNAFNEALRELKIKIRTRKTVSKCDICVNLRQQVSLDFLIELQ